MPNRSGETRKLEQLELEATHADAWAVGGSDESDCVCRGGRCPRMWDCPFWVERRRAEAKGSSAHVRKRITDKNIYIIPILVYVYIQLPSATTRPRVAVPGETNLSTQVTTDTAVA